MPDAIEEDAKEGPVEQLPNDTLVFLLGSRYCETDKLADIAWQLLDPRPGWRRVQAICDFVCDRLTFGYEHACTTRTAFEAYAERKGVCRDFAHLAVAFCRCMNIPARCPNGFFGGHRRAAGPVAYGLQCLVGTFILTDVGSRSTRATMFRALAAITVARGRDAADIALATSFGRHTLSKFRVWTEEIDEAVLADLTRRTA